MKSKTTVMMANAFASLRSLFNPDKAKSPLNRINKQASNDANIECKPTAEKQAATKKAGAKNPSVALDVCIRSSSLDIMAGDESETGVCSPE